MVVQYLHHENSAFTLLFFRTFSWFEHFLANLLNKLPPVLSRVLVQLT